MFRGERYCSEENYLKAISDFSEAIRLDPAYALAYTVAAVLTPSGVTLIRRLPITRRRSGSTRTAVCRTLGAARRIRDKHEIEKAIADFSDAIKNAKGDSYYYLARGNLYRDAKCDYDKAIADYSDAVRLKPYSEAYWSRGLAYFQGSRNFEKARADLDRAIMLDPRSSQALVVRGLLYLQIRRDYSKAIEIFRLRSGSIRTIRTRLAPRLRLLLSG